MRGIYRIDDKKNENKTKHVLSMSLVVVLLVMVVFLQMNSSVNVTDELETTTAITSASTGTRRRLASLRSVSDPFQVIEHRRNTASTTAGALFDSYSQACPLEFTFYYPKHGDFNTRPDQNSNNNVAALPSWEDIVRQKKEYRTKWFQDEFSKELFKGALTKQVMERNNQKEAASSSWDWQRSMLRTIESNGRFIFWQMDVAGHIEYPHMQMSLYREDGNDGSITDVATGSFKAGFQTWKFFEPSNLPVTPKNEKYTKDKTVLELPAGPKEYIVFAANWFTLYQHMLIDHIGYWSMLRHTYPEAHFILFRSQSEKLRHLLADIDEEFASRVTLVNCSSFFFCGNVQLNAPSNTKLSVFVPPVSTRNVQLFQNARRWMQSSKKLNESIPNTLTNRLAGSDPNAGVIIYCQRVSSSSGGGAPNKRYMNKEQDSQIIKMIQHAMKRFNRPEKLIIFDGKDPETLKFKYQYHLFNRASIVIGPHGGMLANTLFLPDEVPTIDTTSSTISSEFACNNRPKVIEFVTSERTPEVQHVGRLSVDTLTYFDLFSANPWMELHQIPYVEPSDHFETLVDLDVLKDVINHVMARGGDNGNYASPFQSLFTEAVRIGDSSKQDVGVIDSSPSLRLQK